MKNGGWVIAACMSPALAVAAIAWAMPSAPLPARAAGLRPQPAAPSSQSSIAYRGEAR